MSQDPGEDRVEHRAELLPEELAVGSDDAEAQARAILEESDDRTEHRRRRGTSPRRHRTNPREGFRERG